MIMVVFLVVVAVITMVWILRTTRSYNFLTMHETDFWAKRVRVRLALAGVLWFFGLVGGVGLFVLCSAISSLHAYAEIPPLLASIVVGLGVPTLLVRSATILNAHLR